MDFLILTTTINFVRRSCRNLSFRARYKQKSPSFHSKTKAEACILSVLAKGIVGLKQPRHGYDVKTPNRT